MVRVRFAPSPTGPLHIGGLRTALFNYFFAKKYQGSLILRIEDTDRNRYVPNSENHILESLSWCGISIDEPSEKNNIHAPYKQSERKDIYKKYIQQLLDSGKAYYAFDTPEELENYRDTLGNAFIYNHSHRLRFKNSLSLPKEACQKFIENNNYVIRFKCPENKNVEINDIIRGNVHFDSNLIDDKVLFKSDGWPTYHLANVIDDHLMEITHVIRGEEWLPSLCLHYLLYEAFGWRTPEFAHLPLILKPNGQGKLSKRDGDKMGIPVFAVPFKIENEVIKNFKDEKYLPEALVNFLSLLGWNSKTEKEIFSMDELIENFELNDVNSTGAKFDIEKLNWFNQQYLQRKSNASLAVEFQKELSEKGHELEIQKVEKIIELIKERAVFSSDFWALSNYLFEDPVTFDSKSLSKCWNENSKEILEYISSILRENNPSLLSSRTKNWIQENSLPMGKVMQTLRIALVGDLKGIDVFEIINIIGIDKAIIRIQNLIKYTEKSC